MRNENTIEEILDSAIDRLTAGEQVSDILKNYPENAEELALLLKSAELLMNAPEPESENSTESLMKIVMKLSNDNPREKLKTIPFRRKHILLQIGRAHV